MNVLENVLYPAVDEINRSGAKKAELSKLPETPLFGQGAAFSSLDLVKFVVLVEEKIESETGQGIRILSDKAMSRKNSPFRTLGAFAEYIDELLLEGKK